MVNSLLSTCLTLALVLECSQLVSARSEAIQSENQIKAKPLKGCIDDTDCNSLEGKNACFKYVCYPYDNDNHISPENRMAKCQGPDDCAVGEKCYRLVHLNRWLNHGRCMPDLGECGKEKDCKGLGGSAKCCNGQFCCKEKHFNQLKTLPCQTDLMCTNFNYGKYCCPQKVGNTTVSTCCDVNPNPPSTPSPVIGGKTNAALPLAKDSFCAFLLVAALLLAAPLW